MKGTFTVKEMTTWLCNHLREQGFETEVYSDLFLPARVPVYAGKPSGKTKKQPAEEIVVDVINSPKIKSNDFFYSLRVYRTLDKKGLELTDASCAIFYQYYFPRAKVYWAYPDYLTKDDEFDKFRKLCQKHKIGLFEVARGKVKEDSTIPPAPLFERVLEAFKSAMPEVGGHTKATKKGKAELAKANENLVRILDHHIEETNKYLIYYPEPEYKRREIIGRTEGRNISLTLVDKLLEIQNLHYKRHLRDLAEQYRTRIEDDYDIALDLTKQLWKLYGLRYPEFQKDFEPVLLLNPRYRDHFLHQLHVFLLGCYIIDKLYDDKAVSGFKKKFGNSIEDAWLFAATYHDYNYNIQNYNEWIATFFKNTLFLDENPSRLRLDECYVKEDYMFKTKELSDAFGLNVDRTTLLFFYEKIISEKNHGLLGALSLLKLYDQKAHSEIKIEKPAMIRAARAIALHDEDIWKHFCGRGHTEPHQKGDSTKVFSDFSRKKAMEKLSFADDPLSFLLILCDTIQEWGRVGRDYEGRGARLDDVGYTDGVVWVNISVRNEESFNEKKDEIDRVKKFLLDDRFKIKLSSREGLGTNIVERHMEGR